MAAVDKLIRDIIKIATGKETMAKVAEEARKRIVTRTRVGKGVPENGAGPTALPALKESTVETRKALKKAGNLTGPGATPSKSALNRTGAMLNDLKAVSEDAKAMVVFGTQSEAAKADDLQSRGFVFMNLSKPEINALIKIIRDEIKAKLKG